MFKSVHLEYLRIEIEFVCNGKILQMYYVRGVLIVRCESMVRYDSAKHAFHLEVAMACH